MSWKVLIGSFLVFGFCLRGFALGDGYQTSQDAIDDGQTLTFQDSVNPMSAEQVAALSQCETHIAEAVNLETHADVKTLITECGSKSTQAGTLCIESLSPEIKGAIAFASGFLNTMNTTSYANACTSGKKAMVFIKDALTAYTATCGAMQWRCESSCSSLLKKLSLPTVEPGYEAIRVKIRTSVLACKSSCDGYTKNLIAGGLGLANLLKRVNDNSKCEQDLKVTVIDCGLTANYQNQKCICERTPQLTGCPGATANSGSTSSTSSVVTASTNLKNPAVDSSGLMTTDQSSSGVSVPGSSSTGGPTGGASPAGVAVSGAGSGAGGKALQKTGAADGGKGGLNTNVLSGDYGGGGGGRSGGGSSSDPSSSAYKSYMPGGSKDPSRNIASQNQAVDQVTGAGGSDNWHKISDRYKDHRSSLLGE